MIKIDKKFYVEIGTIFKDNKRDFIIIDRERRKDNSNSSREWYKYKCNKCQNEDWIIKGRLFRGDGCNVCCKTPQKIIKGINDIATTDPWMIPYLVDKNFTYTHSSNSNVKTEIICRDCKKIKSKLMSPNQLYRSRSIGCECSEGISYPEKIMISILNQLNKNFIRQYSKTQSKWCNKYRYDFYLDDNIIEINGSQHYEDTQWMKYEDRCKLDKDKECLAISNIKGYYIIINCSISKIEYIKKSILNNKELNKILDLSKVDWQKADKFATKNLVKEVCEYYELHKNDMLMKDICSHFNIGKKALLTYVNKGNKLGWCKYDPKDCYGKRSKIYNHPKSKKVLCHELNETFKSTQECARELSKRYNQKFHSSCISRVCRGVINQYKGFTFKYMLNN